MVKVERYPWWASGFLRSLWRWSWQAEVANQGLTAPWRLSREGVISLVGGALGT